MRNNYFKRLAEIDINQSMIDKITDEVFSHLVNNFSTDDKELIASTSIDEILSFFQEKIDDATLDVIEENYPSIFKILMEEADADLLDRSKIINELLLPVTDKIIELIANEFNKSLDNPYLQQAV